MNRNELLNEMTKRKEAARIIGWEWLAILVEEDLDVLRRHSQLRPMLWEHGQPQPTWCSYEFCAGDGWGLDWIKCPDVQSVFRRYGTAPTI